MGSGPRCGHGHDARDHARARGGGAAHSSAPLEWHLVQSLAKAGVALQKLLLYLASSFNHFLLLSKLLSATMRLKKEFTVASLLSEKHQRLWETFTLKSRGGSPDPKPRGSGDEHGGRLDVADTTGSHRHDGWGRRAGREAAEPRCGVARGPHVGDLGCQRSLGAERAVASRGTKGRKALSCWSHGTTGGGERLRPLSLDSALHSTQRETANGDEGDDCNSSRATSERHEWWGEADDGRPTDQQSEYWGEAGADLVSVRPTDQATNQCGWCRR
ncbi:hypothetical protein PR002_g2468 [Phytophthora rubi]|uniref:Uncharacterized protein n=1 Tax=Phytophthora rubi TaxID=129364 RepID=A0A6A3NX89_9STRA|nr:hypothetical protein PR002_g2468 [Phytophthora rubi]